jgi:bile acid:Na+ symporter, BASS family
MTLAALILLTAKASVFLTVLGLGMSARMTDAIYVLRRPGLLLRALLAMALIMPLFATGLAVAFDLPPVVKVALVALAVSPVPPLLPRKQLNAGGNASEAVGFLATAALLSIVVIPVAITTVGRVLGTETHIPIADVAAIVATSVLVPLGIGMALRFFAGRAAVRLARAAVALGAILLVASAVPILFNAWPAIVAHVGNGTLMALAAFSVVGLGVGHVLGGPNPEQRTVLALSTASRHPAIAMTIADANFIEKRAVVATILLYLLVSALVSIVYIRRTRGGGGTADGIPELVGPTEHVSPFSRRAGAA